MKERRQGVKEEGMPKGKYEIHKNPTENSEIVR